MPFCPSSPFSSSSSSANGAYAIVLGDVFVQDMGMEWIMVEDERGRDPAVRLPNTTIILYPMTMIFKRIERGEKVDAFELYNGVAAQVEAIKDKAK